jgi:agmatine deiminase
MPAEWEPHEGTWLQWPHDKIYAGYQMKLEHIWLAMTAALSRHETVHIIAKDTQHQEHIAYSLDYCGIASKNIDLRVIPTDVCKGPRSVAGCHDTIGQIVGAGPVAHT